MRAAWTRSESSDQSEREQIRVRSVSAPDDLTRVLRQVHVAGESRWRPRFDHPELGEAASSTSPAEGRPKQQTLPSAIAPAST
jgi:hypothetical protein